MVDFSRIPELRALSSCQNLIRIAPELDVPLTKRVRRLVDAPAFRRLARISQLGLVSLVYPSATHSRFEHSLGVYYLSLRYLEQLSADRRFSAVVSERDATCLIVTALLHDLGHWPFCHPLEDIRDDRVPRHEALAERLMADEIADLLMTDWELSVNEVDRLLCRSKNHAPPLLASLISGPIDIDKMDYLRRDSLHAGVPYGQNFDQARLIGSLCLNSDQSSLAITDKGRTAAEMMVFARYVMFSEVYWHHTVRSATAMLQRAFYELLDELNLQTLFRQTEAEFIRQLLGASAGSHVEDLMQGLFGPRRVLYKRLAQYSLFQQPNLFNRLARRPYQWLAQLTHHLADAISSATGISVKPAEILIDAPPVKREVEIKIDVFFPKEDCYRPLADVSPVVRTLAERQFDDIVKQVRIFMAPQQRDLVGELPNLHELLHRAIDQLESQASSPPTDSQGNADRG